MKFGDNDLIVMVNGYGDEMHLDRETLGEITLSLDDALDMLREGSVQERAMAKKLEPVAQWLERSENFGRTPLTDPDNMHMEVVPE